MSRLAKLNKADTKSKSASDSQEEEINQRNAPKRKRDSGESIKELEDLQPKPKKAKLIKKDSQSAAKYGFMGEEEQKNFSSGIPFYMPTRAYKKLVAELTSNSANLAGIH
jgi:hypothetical protein